MYLIESEGISVRTMNNTAEDKALLLKWMTTPEVIELVYGEDAPWDMQKIENNFARKITGIETVTACFIEYDGKACGYVQYYPIEKDSYCFNTEVPYEKFRDGYGMDIFIGYPELWGREIGTKTVIAMADYLTNTLGAKVVCADPEEHNQRSVRCWIKAGFSPMGIVENYDDPDKKSIFMAKFLSCRK